MQGYWGLEVRNTPENGGRRELKTKHGKVGLRVLGVGPAGGRGRRRGDGGHQTGDAGCRDGDGGRGVRRGACVGPMRQALLGG